MNKSGITSLENDQCSNPLEISKVPYILANLDSQLRDEGSISCVHCIETTDKVEES